MAVSFRRRLLSPWLWLVLLAGPLTARAHNPDTSYVQVQLTNSQVVIRFTADLFTLAMITNLDANHDGQVSRAELQAAAPVLQQYYREHVRLDLNGRTVELGATGDPVWPADMPDAIAEEDLHTSSALVHLTFTNYVVEIPASVALSFNIFDQLGPAHMVLGTFEYTGQPVEVTFTQTEPDYIYETGYVPSLAARLWVFLQLGLKHIFLGYDHLCFLLALIVVSRFKELIKIVTAFTIAHTLTLILTATQIVTLPTRLVEAGIALTIVYVALENLWIKSTNQRWRLAFFFGLVHGFGFANLLRQLGLPPSGMIRSLLSFNVGVELAQLGIVLALLPFSVWLAEWKYGVRVKNTVSVAIFLLGLTWFSVRALNLRIPGFS